jgi:serralysin
MSDGHCNSHWSPSSHQSHESHGSHDHAGTGSNSVATAKPVGTIAQLSDYLINGYWQSNNTVGHHWGNTTVTYNFGNLTTAEQTIAQAALALWHDVANITFVQTANAANINFNHNGTSQAYASGTWTNGVINSMTIDISSDWVANYGTGLGTYSYQTYIHEIGHALGLGHQGPYNGSATYGTNNAYANDTWQNSIMSYFAQDNYGGASYDFVMTPQMADIYAVGQMYGVATATRTGNTVYGFNSNAGSVYNFSGYSMAPALTLYDSGGTDTLDCSGYGQSQIINLTSGAFSSVGGFSQNIGIYTTTVIENATGGSGNDTIIGNAAANTLIGGGGTDSISAGDGNDTLNGGLGNDTLTGGNGDDTFVYTAGLDTITDFTAGAGGIDEIDLRSFTTIQSFTALMAMATQSGANTVISFSAGNALTLQNVTMGNLQSSDFLFYVPPPPDLTVGSMALSGATLTFTVSNIGGGTAGVSSAGIYLSSDATITTGDTLLASLVTPSVAGGGAVGQIATLTFPTNLTPGTYYLGVLADRGGVVSESSESNNVSNVTPLVLGNSSANTLTGTTGNDVIMGFAGADAIDGGAGVDTASYATSSAGVTISLAAGTASGGDATGDTLASIENLTGSGFNDTLEGNAGNNVLSGGAGVDTVSYQNSTAAVTVNLAATSAQNTIGAGTDTLSGFENLTGSAYNDTLTGSSAANVINGLGGNDVIKGGGGADTLNGGAGLDRFVYTAVSDSGPSARDTIIGFVHGSDVIEVSAIDANTSVNASLDQAFAFAGQNANVVANSITWFESGGNTIVQADVNGDTVADFAIILQGTALNLAAGDFHL